METIKVYTQEELDKALMDGLYPELYGNGNFEIFDSSQVTAFDSSQVRAYDSSQVTACDSSQVTAYGSSQVRACDSSQVTASKYVAITLQSNFHGKTNGGVLIKIPPITSVDDWMDYYGTDKKSRKLILYKGLDKDFKSKWNTMYKPDIKIEAADWDGGQKECGGGLHFCATPFHTLEFVPDAVKFVACEVDIKDIVVTKNAEYPSKVKAKKCKVLYECDIDGNKIEANQ